jgi:hypothetical protein
MLVSRLTDELNHYINHAVMAVAIVGLLVLGEKKIGVYALL